MSTSRHINKICAAGIALMLVVTLLFMCGGNLGISVSAKTVKYESTIFDTSYVHSIDIVMDDWDSFIASCENEEYAACTVVIDGKKHSNIAIRAKGNTSLSSVRSSGSERYSFKLEFDHYQDGKTLDGLDKLCLNNLVQDNTMMKDYLVYQMMADFGVDTPLCSFAYLTVNGEDWGLYLALESVEDSFLSRNYGSDTGELYKPDSLSFGGGRGNGKDFNFDDLDFDFDFSGNESSSDSGSQSLPDQGSFDPGSMGGFDPDSMGSFSPGGEFPGMSGDGSFDPGSMSGFPSGQFPGQPGQSGSTEDPDSSQSREQSGSSRPGGNAMPEGMGGMGGFGMGCDDVKLKYIDDDPDSYSNIFSSAKTDITKADQTRLIESLKKLSSYTDLEDVLDMDEVLRYFVVHVFVCNGDSYTGSMIHNYYLHESDGRLGMIPWDYNLAYGTFTGGNASSSVNSSIYSPVSGSVDDRPMVGWIFSDEKYTEQYHELFSEFIEKWFTNSELEKLIDDTAEMLRPYVEKDPTKFCTTEEFEEGVSVLKQFVSLRAEAVSRQLNGDSTAVETGDLNLSAMGSMGGSRGGAGGMSRPDGNGKGSSENGSDTVPGQNAQPDQNQSGTQPNQDQNAAPSGQMPDGFSGQLPDGFSGQMPDGFSGQIPDGFSGQMPGGSQGGQMPGGSQGGFPSFPGSNSSESSSENSSENVAESTESGSSSGRPQQRPSGSSGGSGKSGSSGSTSFPGGSSFPGGNSKGLSSTASFWILTGASVIILAAGLIIVIKKKV